MTPPQERQGHVAHGMTSTFSLGLQITINGRLEHLRGTALAFRNLTNYVLKSLLDTGGFQARLHPASAMSHIAPECCPPPPQVRGPDKLLTSTT
jgi:hypothetical protein